MELIHLCTHVDLRPLVVKDKVRDRKRIEGVEESGPWGLIELVLPESTR